MIVKLLIGLVILIALARMVAPLRGSAGRGAGDRVDRDKGAPPRVPRAHDLEKCDRCGIWRPAGQGCDCDARA